MSINEKLLSDLHHDFPGKFPIDAPRHIRRSGKFLVPIDGPTDDDVKPLDFDAALPEINNNEIQAVVAFLPFLEPAVGNSDIAEHPTFHDAVLIPFVETLKESSFVFPLRLLVWEDGDSADLTDGMRRGGLPWIATASLDDLRRLMCGIIGNMRIAPMCVDMDVSTGMVSAILNRFDEKLECRSIEQSVADLLLWHDPMGIDYGCNADEYAPEVPDILERLPQCQSVEDVQKMLYEVIGRWFHAYYTHPMECFEPLAIDLWSLFQVQQSGSTGG